MTTPPQLRDASPIVVWSREGSAWRIACRKCVQDLVVRVHLLAREILVVVVGAQRRRLQQLASELDAGDRDAPVDLLRKIVRLDLR